MHPLLYPQGEDQVFSSVHGVFRFDVMVVAYFMPVIKNDRHEVCSRQNDHTGIKLT